MTSFINPDLPFFDNVTGDPVALGTAYFGEPNLDPKTNTKAPYSSINPTVQSTATQSLTSAGKLAQRLWLIGAYSLTVDDADGNQIFSYAEVEQDLTDSIWALFAGTPTFISATLFRVSGDQTSTFEPLADGMLRVKFDDASTLYGTVTDATYSAGPNRTDVTVVLDGDADALTGSLTAVYTSIASPSEKPISADSVQYLAPVASTFPRDARDLFREQGLSIFDFMTEAQRADFTAGTGSIDISSAIQATIDAIEAVGIPGVVVIPYGKGKCDTGLVVDTTLTTIMSWGGMLEFTDLAQNGYAFTLEAHGVGFASGAYYSGINYIKGLRIKGEEGASEGAFPTAGNEKHCFKLVGDSMSSLVLIGYSVENVVVSHFTRVVEIGNEAWGTSFKNMQCAFNEYQFYSPSGILAAGTGIKFTNCIWQNGRIGFFGANTTGLNVTLTDCNLESMTDVFVDWNAGSFTQQGGQIEQASGHLASIVVRRDSTVNVGVSSYVTFLGVDILIKGLRTQPFVDYSNPMDLSFHGGEIFADSVTYASSYFNTDGSSLGTGTLTILGTRWTLGTAPNNLFTGLDSSIARNTLWATVAGNPNQINFDNSAAVLGTGTSNSRDLDHYDEGDWTPTPVSLTTTGSPTYTGTYTRIGDRVICDLVIDANGGTTASTANTTRFTGIPFTMKTGYGTVATCVTDTTVDQGMGRAEGLSVFTPTWTADALKRYVKFEYIADS